VEATVEPNLPTPPDRRHGIADVLRLVDANQAIAYEPSHRSTPDHQMRRIRDLFLEHNHPQPDDDR
jgi:hypothetical protein